MAPANPLSAIFGAGPPPMDTDQMNRILQPYGVSMPTSYQQPGPFENMPSFGQAHPRVAQGLDNALIAVSLMGPTGATAGENISNAARGILGVGPYRRQFMAQQAEMPLHVAGQVAQLQHLGAENQELGARAGYYQHLPEMWGNRDDSRTQSALIRGQLTAAQHPRLGRDAQGNEVVQTPYFDEQTNQVQWKEDRSLDVNDFKKNEAHSKLGEMLGGSLAGINARVQLQAKYGDQLPALMQNPTPEFARDMNATYSQIQKESSGFQGKVYGETNIPASDTYKDFMAAQKGVLGKYQYNVKDRDKEVRAETNRLMAGTLNNGAKTMDLGQVQQQAEANVNQRIQHDQQLATMFGQFSQLPPESQMQYGGFAGFAAQNGYDAQNHHFSNNIRGQATPPGQQQGAPAAMGGAAAGQLSPSVQAIINQLK